MQTQQDEILEAQTILDDILNDEKSPLHDPRHMLHAQVSRAVDALQAEIYRLTVLEGDDMTFKRVAIKGRSKLNCREEEIIGYLAQGKRLTDIARILGCGRSTLFLWLQSRFPGIEYR